LIETNALPRYSRDLMNEARDNKLSHIWGAWKGEGREEWVRTERGRNFSSLMRLGNPMTNTYRITIVECRGYQK